MTTAQGSDQITAYYENGELTQSIGTQPVSPAFFENSGAFYYEPSTDTSNFGNGINLSAAAGNSTLESEINLVLASLSVAIDWNSVAVGSSQNTANDLNGQIPQGEISSRSRKTGGKMVGS